MALRFLCTKEGGAVRSLLYLTSRCCSCTYIDVAGGIIYQGTIALDPARVEMKVSYGLVYTLHFIGLPSIFTVLGPPSRQMAKPTMRQVAMRFMLACKEKEKNAPFRRCYFGEHCLRDLMVMRFLYPIPAGYIISRIGLELGVSESTLHDGDNVCHITCRSIALVSSIGPPRSL